MAKIVFYLPGNATHSFLIEDRWQKMYEQRCGLNAIGQSGLPVAVSHQGIDYELFPFLREFHNQYQNIEVTGAPYGHGLLPLIRFGSKKEANAQILWELKNGVKTNNLPVTFFPEFYTPEEREIPTDFFFFLKDQTCSYSLDVTGISLKEEELSPVLPENAIAVRYGSRIGIMLNGFQNFLKVWYPFSAVPDERNLQAVLAAVDRMADDPREFIVVPLDLEQPFVGSAVGEALWQKFFAAVVRRKSAEKIVPLSSILDRCREKAVSIKQPQRMLGKWTVHMIQLNNILKLNGLRLASDKERRLFSFAFASDHLSSLNRQVLSTIEPVKKLQCQDLKGNKVDWSQAQNPVLQGCCNAAYLSLRHRESFVKKLERIDPNFFVQRLIAWAESHGL